MLSRIVDLLFDFSEQSHNSSTYWIDQSRGIFREKIDHGTTKVDIIANDYGTHICLIAGLLQLKQVPAEDIDKISGFSPPQTSPLEWLW